MKLKKAKKETTGFIIFVVVVQSLCLVRPHISQHELFCCAFLSFYCSTLAHLETFCELR